LGAQISDATSPSQPALATRGAGAFAVAVGFLAVGATPFPGIGGVGQKVFEWAKRPPQAPAEDPSTFAAVMSLGTVRVELRIDADDNGIGLSGVAFEVEDERPVVGVIATLRMEPREGDAIEITRTTDAPEGDFGRISIPHFEGARCTLRLSYRDAHATFEW
jgi:hypothetical protein